LYLIFFPAFRTILACDIPQETQRKAKGDFASPDCFVRISFIHQPSAPSSPSILSTPHARPTGSPRKVSFAPSANARIFTSSAENTAQFDRMTQQHTYEPSSDSEDDRPIAASLNFGIPVRYLPSPISKH
jgi:hypothetical protein